MVYRNVIIDSYCMIYVYCSYNSNIIMLYKYAHIYRSMEDCQKE